MEGGGLEYLLGVASVGDDGGMERQAFWRWTNGVAVILRAVHRPRHGELAPTPSYHVYHFSPYELVVVKRLMGHG